MAEPTKNDNRPLFTINQQSRSDEIVTIAILIALLVLVGLVGLFWSTWNRVALAPTPTPTATSSPPVTSTPDRAATQIAVQLATQTAEAVALAQRLDATQTAIVLLTEQPTLTSIALTQEASASASATAEAQLTLAAQLTATQVVTNVNSTDTPNNLQTPAPRADEPLTTTNISIYNPIVTGDDSQQGEGDTGQSGSTQGTTTIISPTAAAAAIAPTVQLTATAQLTATIQPTPTQSILTERNPLPASTGVYVPVAINSESPTETPVPPEQPTLPPTTVPADLTGGEGTDGTTDGAAEEATVAPAEDTLAPTPTETLTPTPVPTPTPIPTRFVQEELDGVVSVGDNEKAKLRSNPLGNEIGELEHNTQLSLKSRTLTGEWINVCCLNQQVGWLRRTELKIENNVLDAGAPDDADPNDTRWLRVEGAQANNPLARPPQVQLPPAGTYPLFRGNSANQGRVTQLPTAPVSSFWEGKQGIASAQVVSPITLSASGVFVNTQDGRLYSFAKDTGDERWRVSFEPENIINVSRASVINGTQLYAVGDTGFMYRFEDGSSEEATWTVRLEVNNTPLTPVTNINMSDGNLYLGARNETTHYLASVRQADGLFRFPAQELQGASMQYPAIGGQLVFIGTDVGVFARDTSDGTEVWANTENLSGISAPPVYGYPGVEALSELYVARQNGELIALDANTGARLWAFSAGSAITGMALDDDYLYATVNGFLKVISREERGMLADIGISGSVPSGPVVSATTIMVVTSSGEITFVERGSWRVIDSRPADGTGVTSFAANGPVLYIHNNGTSVRGFRTQQ